MTTAFLAAEPRLFLHGHFHVSGEAWVEQFDHATHVVSLDCDGAPDGNLVLVTLPDRGSGEEPAIDWLPVLADKRRGEFPDDVVAPKAPMTEWTVYDVVGVLNNGRSVHWKALA